MIATACARLGTLLIGALVVAGAAIPAAAAGTPAGHHPDVVAAKKAWRHGARTSSAMEGRYWIRAAGDLRSPHGTYAPQITQLRQLIALPDSGLTKAQLKAFHHDVTALDSFFDTPGLYL